MGKSVPRTEMRAEERVEVVSVPCTRQTTRPVEKTVMETVHEQRQVPKTTMVPKCVQDRFEETKVLQFDPQTGTQLAGATVQGIRSEIEQEVARRLSTPGFTA